MKVRYMAILGIFLWAAGALAQPNFELNGFLTAHYNTPSLATSFALSQAEVDLQKEGRKASFRLDLDTTGSVVALGSPGDANLEVEQGYVKLHNVLGKDDLAFTFGKFNAPVGLESLDPVDISTITHSLVFNYGIPTNVTGAMLTKQFGEDNEIRLFFSNGWNTNLDNNKGKDIGLRIVINRESFSWGVSSIFGPEKANSSGAKRWIVDTDLSFEPSDLWKFGGEFNWGREEGKRTIPSAFVDKNGVVGANSITSRVWYGILLSARRQLNESTGVSGRFDLFNTHNNNSKNWSLTAALDRQYSEHVSYKLETTFLKTDTPAALLRHSAYLYGGFELTYAF